MLSSLDANPFGEPIQQLSIELHTWEYVIPTEKKICEQPGSVLFRIHDVVLLAVFKSPTHTWCLFVLFSTAILVNPPVMLPQDLVMSQYTRSGTTRRFNPEIT